MKKFFVLVFAFLIIGLTAAPQIPAQSQEQLEAINELTNELVEGKITYGEYLRRGTEIMNAPLQMTPEAAQLFTPAGKAWIIQDNDVQGSGRAIVFKADGGIEAYERRFGVWSPDMDNLYSTTTYTANGNRISIISDDDFYEKYTGDFDYTITGGGSTLTIKYDEGTSKGLGGADGVYTLGDFPEVHAPGGSIVNAIGTAWEISHGGSIEIFHTDGIRYSFGGSDSANRWDYMPNRIWNTYTATTGKLTQYYHDNRHNKPEEFNYSVTDFGNGRKTLRLWRESRMAPYDEVWKLTPVPSGFQLPKAR